MLSASRSANSVVDRVAARPCAMNRRTAASPQRRARSVNMWWRTRWTTRSVAGARARAAGRAALRPARRRPTRGRRTGRRPSVAGLPMSWSERGQPDDRAVRGRGVDRPRACGPTGPRPRSCSGACRAAPRARARRPRAGRSSAMSRSPTDGRGAASSFSSSAAIRSPGQVGGERRVAPDRRERRRLDRRSRASPRAGPRGPSAARPPRTAARIADRAQDAARRRRRARRTGRRGRRRRSPAGVAPQAIALTVKSRRARSASSDVAELDPVRPPEVGVVVVGPERRDLVLVAAARTATVPNGSRRPRRGRASSSPLRAARRWRGPSPAARRPRSTSRSEPPTTYAAWPRRPERRRARPRTAAGTRRRARRRDGAPRRRRAAGLRCAVSSGRGTGTSARPRCARRRGTA